MSYWKTGEIIQKGRYVIEKVLGASGAGITYRAKDVNTGKIIAIKTLNATLQAQPDFAKHKERFIDKLWVKYSRGKFGFSVQKRIYLSLGGKRIYNQKTWEALSDRVAWRVNGKWLFSEDLNYTINAPQGHLPSIAMSGILDRGIYTLISRMMDCNLSYSNPI